MGSEKGVFVSYTFPVTVDTAGLVKFPLGEKRQKGKLFTQLVKMLSPKASPKGKL